MNSVSTQFGKQLVRGLMLAGAILFAPFSSADDFRIESKQGPVESVDYSTNKMVVGGVSYNMAADANVQLGGSYGAFTMITPGMNQRGTRIDPGPAFHRHGRVERQIIEVKELAPGVVPQQY